ncbi:unnamed protein product [Prunus armeniaca]
MATGLGFDCGYFVVISVRSSGVVGYVAGVCIPKWDRTLTGGIRNYGQKVDTEPEQMRRRILGWN